MRQGTGRDRLGHPGVSLSVKREEALTSQAFGIPSMTKQPSSRPTRALKAGGPPAAITAGIGAGATGVAGNSIEAKTDPVANGVAAAVGLDPQAGPVLLFGLAVLVLVVAFVLPGIFEGHAT